MEIFQDEGQNLTVKGKGVLPATLGESWTKLEKVVQSYITCEGRKDVVRPRHLKLLVVLKGKCSVNLPVILNSLLHDASRSLKKAQHEEAVVSHHGLIRLIVSHSLTQQQSSWGELITVIEGGLAAPPTKPKHSSSTPEQPEKRRESEKRRHSSSTPQQPFIRVKKEKENKGIQTEAPPLGVIRVLNSKQRNKKVQVKLPASTVSWNKDPKTRTLHHMMKQVQQEAEQLKEQTVPREKYEELQQQLRNISQFES